MHLAKMGPDAFRTVSDERLGWLCMEPVFKLIRAKPPAVKAEVIAQLNNGQKALCMFRVFYDHSYKSAAEYYAWLSYVIDMPGYWDGIRNGLLFFGDTAMIRLMEETRSTLEQRNHRLGLAWGDAAFKDLDQDPELAGQMAGFYERFQKVSAESLAVIAAYIRAHPEEFVELQDAEQIRNE